MANKMLIDASHPEETRVVVLRGNRVEDFDFESASKKPLRGNIYLAKVTRVEPSLQAAFIEYGGNRHGFLAFSEIHPDYYQIPVADRQALLDEEARAHREDEDEPRSGHNGNGRRSRRHRSSRNGQSEKRAELGDETVSGFAEQADPQPEASFPETHAFEDNGSGEPSRFDEAQDASEVDHERAPEATIGEEEPFDDEPAFEAAPESDQFSPELEDAVDPKMPGAEPAEALISGEQAELQPESGSETAEKPAGDEGTGSDEEEEFVEQIGGDALEDATYRAPRLRRHYKIQEVIKRRQILLVQVVKEERGNKGAALTTYLSLAGRYSVLMPNTARGGGISRKITDADDRKRLKSIAQELEVPEGMGIILRTAGAARGETEVKRDFEYLLRMWETVRELTLTSSAPKLVYEEGSLIKRTIRDLYSKEVDEIWVAGDGGYREARDYMRLLMPTHVKNVHVYDDPQPIFAKAGAEAQLDAMFSNHVTLKSGGYIVINQTEALVAIDVNSGRSTREHNIEDTALRTNLEAADEVARQLRLRDLAGLIVVDFIDMEEGRNNRAVERRIKDALRNDRARIQIGRISHFGLLEMSRQRIRTGVLEGSTVICPHCAGAGTVRSTSSIALHVLRVLEDTLIRSASHNLIVRTRTEVALYILNQKRANLSSLEHRFGVQLVVMADGALTGTVYHTIERGELATPPAPIGGPSALLDEAEDNLDLQADEEVEEVEEDEMKPRAAGGEDGQRPKREGEIAEGAGDGRRRRRRRRRGRDKDARGPGLSGSAGDLSDETSEPTADESELPLGEPTGEDEQDGDRGSMVEAPVPSLEAEPAEAAGEDVEAQPELAEPEPRRRRRSRRTAGRATGTDAEEPAEAAEPAPSEEAVTAPRRSRRSRARPAEEAPSLLGFERPSADRDVGADTAVNHPADTVPAAAMESTEPEGLADLALTPVEPLEPAIPSAPESASVDPDKVEPAAPAEPPRPKRSGWWQRAKATLTGE